ncbi:hypothetical protein NP493_752g01071 [Ridgeia piscesae]|uniref:Uncharacterized protein n=1 Tax=Ridgeia piscesae TaxID=27915 RepID=A0AAD9KP37_RIDPI|nr:hypothetical protein NP493_752g01071 [Ridgeia piscesae]
MFTDANKMTFTCVVLVLAAVVVCVSAGGWEVVEDYDGCLRRCNEHYETCMKKCKSKSALLAFSCKRNLQFCEMACRIKHSNPDD